jgi:GDP-mannose 4,6-dehydratase
MNIISTIKNCRLCKSEKIIDIISLGEQFITSRFPVFGDFSTPKTPIDLCKCEECGLLQLKQTTYSSELYEYEYGYRSGISNTMREHLKNYQEEILSIVSLNDGDVIVDIGSNDSTMLQYYSNSLKRIGVDPTGKQFQQYYGDVELLPTYFTIDNFRTVYPELKCKVVSSISMFYDLPDPVQFAKDIFSILHEDGIWTCEQSYMPTMLKTNSIDTICHEHLEYYALTQVKNIADRAGFKIIDVKFNDCNGGSFRVYFAKKSSIIYSENTNLIEFILNDENSLGIMDNKIYKEFISNCDKEIDKLCEFIKYIQENSKNMYVYGASTKGNCLLQYAKLGNNHMKYAVERNPKKIGKMTSTGIEIISEETMRENPPNYLLVLPWHFRKEIIEREDEFLRNGGQLVFPFPKFEIVSQKPIALLTGCEGFIAEYVKQEFSKSYTLYGICKEIRKVSQDITKFQFDIKETECLEKAIQIIKPNAIIHLAGISSSQYAFSNPLETIQTNGLVTATLCDIIKRNNMNIKLFNASSSEMYNGHVNYEVKESDTMMNHNHPYSIAKILGHSIIDFYRETYGLSFSNGILFTTESSKKRHEFLINKVKAHSKRWIHDNIPLELGNLDSYRNITHAKDVASAIYTIIEQPIGNNYLICNYESNKIYDIVVKIYQLSGIQLEMKNNLLIEKSSGKPVVIIKETPPGLDYRPINIRGYPTRLTELGWAPKISLEDILKE